MRDSRSASQVLYGLLPHQTIDARGGVWKVTHWSTETVHDVDDDELRRALQRVAAPWEAEGTDQGFVAALRAGRSIRVETLDRRNGVRVDAFPKTWRCKNRSCNRLHRSSTKRCECGSRGPHGQLSFVLFHDACGEIREPYYPECPQHGQVRMDLPGTTNLSEIKLSCPVCSRDLGRHFLNTRCQCGVAGRRRDRGEFMEFAVHRSAAVYTPRTIVIVNPPSKTQMRELVQAGGPQAALTWMSNGMHASWIDKVEGAKAAALRRDLMDRGIDADTVERMMAQSNLSDAPSATVTASPAVIDEAQNQSASIALAMSKTRQTITDLADAATGSAVDRYRGLYPATLADAGIGRVDLVERFPVLTGQYGFTRGDQEPGQARLRAFMEKDGTFVVYGDLAATEALVFRLDPTKVCRWLAARGHAVSETGAERDDYEAILQAFGDDPESSPVYDDVVTLIHSMSHRVVRQASFYAGIDRNALSELLFPYTLCFVTYAVPRGDFVLGGLQALFEHDLHTVLDRVVHDESRCALDPGCASNPHGAACAVCLHLGEPSCRLFNTKLDRKALFARQDGYFTLASR